MPNDKPEEKPEGDGQLLLDLLELAHNPKHWESPEEHQRFMKENEAGLRSLWNDFHKAVGGKPAA